MWDWNGTLLNDLSVIEEVEQVHFPIYGIKPPSSEDRKKLFCFPIEKYYAKLGFDFSKHSFSHINAHFMDIYNERLQQAPLFEGTRDLLRQLRVLGKRNYILSAAPQTHLELVVLDRDIDHYFDGIYGLPHLNADTKVARGHEMIAHEKINPKTTIMFGDTDHDYEVAKALGFEVVLIADGHKDFEELGKLGCRVLETRFGAFQS